MKLWRYGRAIEMLGQRYRLEGMLGSGGMADVCLAWDEREQCEVAIKVLKPGELEQKALDRFQKEAAQVARWRHPNILRFYGEVRLELLDAVQGSIVPYIVMEYAPGGDLHKRLRPGQPYPLAQTLIVFIQLCRAVAYAHEQGVIHRDLKPMNILFRQLADGTEQAVLSDFGLAVEIDASHFTYAGAGTLPYMAPEQLRGHAEPASDIFALGVILYQLCTGQLPFKRTLQDLGRRRPLSVPAAPSSLNYQLPPELDAVILSALASDPADRYADAMQFWQCVEDIIDMETFEKVHSFVPNDPSMPAQPTAHPSSNSLHSEHSRKRFVAPAIPPAHPPQMTQLRAASTPPGTRLPTNILRPPDLDSERQTSKSATYPRAIDLPTSYERDTGPYARSVRPIPALRQPSTPHTNPPTRPRRPRWLLIGSLLLLSLLLIGIVTAYTTPNLPNPLRNILPGVAPAASVSVIPASQTIANSYQFSGVASNPDPAQRQVSTRQLTASSQSQPQKVTATGRQQTAGVAAMGTLKFSNGSFSAQMVTAGTVFKGNDGVQVVNDDVVNMPAASSNGVTLIASVVYVPAHAVNGGKKGNIASGDVNLFPCCNSTSIAVFNATVFTGGQDAQNYTFLQQSDIDQATASVKTATLEAQARANLSAQLQAGEQLTSAIQCTVSSKASQPVGPNTGGVSITSAMLTVSDTCSGTAYDQRALQSATTSQLTEHANTTLGPGYALSGLVSMQVSASGNSATSISLLVSAKGIWIYQLGPAQLRTLAGLLAGKSVADANSLLMHQKGIKQAFIHSTRDVLPGDAGSIIINVQNTP